MAEPHKHHFLPVFYLKNWAQNEGKLVQFSRPYKNIVKPQRKHPDGTGYIDKLYAIEGFGGAVSQEVEKSFLSPVDSRAASALLSMLKGEMVTPQERKAWAHFIMTLLLRMPTEIQLLKQFTRAIESEVQSWLDTFIRENIPSKFHGKLDEAFQELRESTMSRQVEQILGAMSDDELIDRLVAMEWEIIDTASSQNDLLTSDRPVVVNRNEQTEGNTVIVLPVGPRKLFVASTAPKLVSELKKVGAKKLTEVVNIDVVGAADQYVYGSSDRQLRFIQNRFGMNRAPSFVTDILQKANLNIGSLMSMLPGFDDTDAKAKISAAVSRWETISQAKTTGDVGGSTIPAVP